MHFENVARLVSASAYLWLSNGTEAAVQQTEVSHERFNGNLMMCSHVSHVICQLREDVTMLAKSMEQQRLQIWYKEMFRIIDSDGLLLPHSVCFSKQWWNDDISRSLLSNYLVCYFGSIANNNNNNMFHYCNGNTRRKSFVLSETLNQLMWFSVHFFSQINLLFMQ